MSKKTKVESITSRLTKILAEPGNSESGARFHGGLLTAPAKLMHDMELLRKRDERIDELERELADAKAEFELDVDLIDPNPWQPRLSFDPEKMAELIESIAKTGLVEPVVVRRITAADGAARYQLVAGERRLRAHRELNQNTIRAVIVDVDEKTQAAMAMAGNIARQDLSDYEMYRAIVSTWEGFANRARMAEAMGMSLTRFHRYLAFEVLPDFITADLEADPTLLGSHGAYALAGLIRKHDERALKILPALWKKLKKRHLDQAKIMSAGESMLAGKPVQDRGIRTTRRLFDDNGEVAQITSDGKELLVKIKREALSGEDETKLEQFITEILGPQQTTG